MTVQMTNKLMQGGMNNVTINGIHMETLLGTVNAIKQEPDLGQCKFRASNTWLGGNQNRTTITGFYGAGQEIAHKQQFELHADEPFLLAFIVEVSGRAAPAHLASEKEFTGAARHVDPQVQQRAGRDRRAGPELNAPNRQVDGRAREGRAHDLGFVGGQHHLGE